MICNVDIEVKTQAGIVKIRVKNRNHVRCVICSKFPNIVKQYNPFKPLAIVNETGTRLQSSVINDHLKSACHIACVRANRITSIPVEERPSTSMEKAIRNANQMQLTHISRLMLEVFFDAKYLSLTEYSWPARHVVASTSYQYVPNIPFDHLDRTVPENINLQYVNPQGHAEMMTKIVEAHRGDFMEKLRSSWAISLRIDGSIDFTNIDKI